MEFSDTELWRELYRRVRELKERCPFPHVRIIALKYAGTYLCEDNLCTVFIRCGWEHPVHIEGVTGHVNITREQLEYIEWAKKKFGLTREEAILLVGEEWPGIEEAKKMAEQYYFETYGRDMPLISKRDLGDIFVSFWGYMPQEVVGSSASCLVPISNKEEAKENLPSVAFEKLMDIIESYNFSFPVYVVVETSILPYKLEELEELKTSFDPIHGTLTRVVTKVVQCEKIDDAYCVHKISVWESK